MICPDTDALVTVGQALDWRVEEGARHLAGCTACGRRLAELAELRGALTAGVPTAPGFTEEVMESLGALSHRRGAAARADTRGAGRPGAAGRLLCALLGGATTALALPWLGGAVAAGPTAPGPTAAVAILSGLVVLWWSGRGAPVRGSRE